MGNPVAPSIANVYMSIWEQCLIFDKNNNPFLTILCYSSFLWMTFWFFFGSRKLEQFLHGLIH